MPTTPQPKKLNHAPGYLSEDSSHQVANKKPMAASTSDTKYPRMSMAMGSPSEPRPTNMMAMLLTSTSKAWMITGKNTKGVADSRPACHTTRYHVSTQ